MPKHPGKKSPLKAAKKKTIASGGNTKTPTKRRKGAKQKLIAGRASSKGKRV